MVTDTDLLRLDGLAARTSPRSMDPGASERIEAAADELDCLREIAGRQSKAIKRAMACLEGENLADLSIDDAIDELRIAGGLSPEQHPPPPTPTDQIPARVADDLGRVRASNEEKETR